MAAKNAAVAAGGNHGRLKKMCFTVSMNTYFKCIFFVNLENENKT